MSTQAQLLPSLFALLPADQLELMLARLSLMAIHVEAYHVQDDLYHTTHAVLPNQTRILRVRGRRRPKRKAAPSKGEWEYGLTWVSAPLPGREYADMCVQASIGLEVAGMGTREEVEDFVKTMGFKHSHSYTRAGHLFHLPVPGVNSTLHLTVTRMLRPGETAADHESEPYFVQVQPARPVGTVPVPRELSLQDAMRAIQNTVSGIDGLKWETGTG